MQAISSGGDEYGTPPPGEARTTRGCSSSPPAITTSTNNQETNMHGPECPQSQARYQGLTKADCQCVLCHCGGQHVPGGFLGTCQSCGRKRGRNA